MQRAYDAHDPARRLLITYEELRRESKDAFMRLMEFVDAPMGKDALEKMITDVRLENFPAAERGPDLPRQEGKIGAYRSNFSADEIQLMTSIMADNLTRYGYHDGAPSSLSPEAWFPDVRDRLPAGLSPVIVNGLYHDLWSADCANLAWSTPEAIRSVSATLYIPAAFFSVHSAWTITVSGGGHSKTTTIVNANPVTVTLPITAEENEHISLAFSCDRSVVPSEDLGQSDERRLAFSIIKIDAKKS